jgi:hypothetical protein
MSGVVRTSLCLLATACLAAGWSDEPQSAPSHPSYRKILSVGQRAEWRFHPLAVDLNRDGHLDLVATARRVKNALHIWFGDRNGAFKPVDPTWTDIGYAALSTGDINRDGFPDIVGASHFAGVQALLSDGKGQFTEKLLKREDGYVAAQLAEFNGDGHLDLVLVGYQKAAIEIYFGDGKGNWALHKTLPESRPGRTMPGRAVAVGDLNQDGHLDVVAAFQRWGIYVYLSDGRGGFSGGHVDFSSATQAFESIALADVNKDRHVDIVINGTRSGPNQLNGPDVYLGNSGGTWKTSSVGLKVLKFATAGLSVGDLDRDGNLDIVAAGNVTGDPRSRYGLFWFRGDGTGGWQLVQESGLPDRGLSVPYSVTLADLDGDRVLEIIALNGGNGGSITIWKQRQENAPALLTQK